MRIVPVARQQLSGGLIDLEGQLLLREAFLQAFQLNLDNPRELLFVEAVEDDDVIHAVQKFRPEMSFQLRSDPFGHLRLALEGPFAVLEIFLNDRRANVAGHDHERVFEIDGPPLSVREPTVIEHLQQHVEDVVMRLFDLIKQHHAVRPAPDRFAELAAFFVADISGRRADEPRDGVLFHVFAHVDAHHRIFVVKQKFRECASQLGLANAGRPHEDERADRPVRVLQAAARATHRIGHRGDGLTLSHHALSQSLLHLYELLPFAFEHPRDRNARPG